MVIIVISSLFEYLHFAGGRRHEAGGRRQEAGGRRQEAGGRRQEVRKKVAREKRIIRNYPNLIFLLIFFQIPNSQSPIPYSPF